MENLKRALRLLALLLAFSPLFAGNCYAFIFGSSGNASISDDAYSSAWDSDTTGGASRHAIYEKIEALLLGAGTHDAITLDANADAFLKLTSQELGLDTQTANYIFAGPASGSADAPAFRALVADDIPDLFSLYEAANADLSLDQITFTISGNGSTIAANASGHKIVPYNCTISKVEIVSSASGSIVVDIKKSTYSDYPTFTSIAASAKPTLSAAVKATDSTLTGWTKTLSAGDRVQALVNSADINGTVVLTLYVSKT